MPTLTFPVVTLAALLDSINPCAFSVLLLTIAFLFSLGNARRNILKIGLSFIAGIYATYLLVGVGVLEVLTFFGVPHIVGKIGAAILIIVGVSEILHVLIPSFPIKFKIPKSAHPRLARFMEKSTIPAGFLLGVLVAIHEFPCTGGPYLMILGLLHDAGRYVSGFLWLLYYNFVFVIPLILILIFASSEKLYTRFEAWKKGHMRSAELIVSIGMVVLGVIIFLF